MMKKLPIKLLAILMAIQNVACDGGNPDPVEPEAICSTTTSAEFLTELAGTYDVYAEITDYQADSPYFTEGQIYSVTILSSGEITVTSNLADINVQLDNSTFEIGEPDSFGGDFEGYFADPMHENGLGNTAKGFHIKVDDINFDGGGVTDDNEVQVYRLCNSTEPTLDFTTLLIGDTDLDEDSDGEEQDYWAVRLLLLPSPYYVE